MKNKLKFSLVGLFIFALAPFSGGIRAVAASMAYSGIEYNFVAKNWISLSTLLLALVFALGWWIGALDEYLFLNDKRKLAIFTFLGILMVYGVVFSSSILVTGFVRYTLKATGDMLVSGFCFRLSVMNSEVISKTWTRN